MASIQSKWNKTLLNRRKYTKRRETSRDVNRTEKTLIYLSHACIWILVRSETRKEIMLNYMIWNKNRNGLIYSLLAYSYIIAIGQSVDAVIYTAAAVNGVERKKHIAIAESQIYQHL